MNLSRFATQNLRAILFVTLILCGIGAVVITTFPVSILPDVTFPRLVVIAKSGELPVKMMEAEISRPMEQTIATVPGVTDIRSRLQRGATAIDVDFSWGSDMLTNEQIVNTRLSQLRSSLPAGTQIHVARMNPTVFPIYGISLQSKSLTQAQLHDLAIYTLQPWLSRVPGVARVEVQGGRVPEIGVSVDPQKLAAFHLTQAEVESAIAQTNQIQAVGLINRHYQGYQAMVSGETITPAQIGGIVVSHTAGVPVLLSQVASIKPTVQDQTMMVTANGKQSVLLNIIRQPDANTVTTVLGVKKAIQAIKGSLPPSIKINTFYDQSILINGAVGSVRDAVLTGAILAVFVLMLFLGDIRATVVTALIIPSTVLITFLLMRLAGLTLNLMTLGALAVGIGLVIDDAIVVVENVFRHLSHGESPGAAIQRAAKEIAAPMVSSTLTTVVVFMPLMLLSGIAGAFFTALAVTLSIALMVSLALALLVSPSLCAAFLRVRTGTEEHGRLFERFLQGYEYVLRICLRRAWVLPAAAVVLIACTGYFATHVGSGFMPEMDEGSFILDYVTPPGTSLKESNRILMNIEQILMTTPEVKSFSRRTGSELGFAITEPNAGDFAVMLHTRRTRGINAIMDGVRQRILTTVPGVDIDFSQALQDLIGDLSGAPAPIEIKLFGDHPSLLRPIARHIAAQLGKIPGVVDQKSGVVVMGPELIINVDPIKAGRAGLTPQMVAQQVNGAMYGDVVTQVLQGEKQIAVRVRFPSAYRKSRLALEFVPIVSPAGFSIPLSSLATITKVPHSYELRRENQRRLVDVTARISGRDLGSVMDDVKAMMARQTLPAGVNYVLGGQYQSQKQAFTNLMAVLALAILLVYSVMLFQFGSFTSPTVILIVMPLSLFGVTFGLWITGTPFNVSSFMGAIMLVGIVVKNGILLLDQAQKAEFEGVHPEEAVVQAGRVRLRPILMTTLTAILGLAPLALGIGAGAQMQQPLAIAVIGGLTFSTLFTLLYAPLLYVVFRRVQQKWRLKESSPELA